MHGPNQISSLVWVVVLVLLALAVVIVVATVTLVRDSDSNSKLNETTATITASLSQLQTSLVTVQRPTIDFAQINSMFTADSGIIVFMSDYHVNYPLGQKILLKNNVYDDVNKTQKIQALSYLNERLPLNVYASNHKSKTVGLLLNPNFFKKHNVIKCAVVKDSNSVNKQCQDGRTTKCSPFSNTDRKCQPGRECSEQDKVAINAGCGVHCLDESAPCNTIKWCSNFSEEEIVNNYKNGTWGSGMGAPYSCVFRNVDEQFVRLSQIFRKSIDPKKEYYLETELNGSVEVNEQTSSDWLEAIIGVFETSDPGYTCACSGAECGAECCFIHNDSESILNCMKENNCINMCQLKSRNTVQEMVKMYNSLNTGHKIKAWSMKNIKRNAYNGWEAPEYKVDLKRFLVELK